MIINLTIMLAVKLFTLRKKGTEKERRKMESRKMDVQS